MKTNFQKKTVGHCKSVNLQKVSPFYCYLDHPYEELSNGAWKKTEANFPYFEIRNLRI